MNKTKVYFDLGYTKQQKDHLKSFLTAVVILMLSTIACYLIEKSFFSTSYFKNVFQASIFGILVILYISYLKVKNLLPKREIFKLVNNVQDDVLLTNTIRQIYKIKKEVSKDDILKIKNIIQNHIDVFYNVKITNSGVSQFTIAEIEKMEYSLKDLNAILKNFKNKVYY